jgi:acetoin utilization deacetylase AcuC-like enzyme
MAFGDALPIPMNDSVGVEQVHRSIEVSCLIRVHSSLDEPAATTRWRESNERAGPSETDVTIQRVDVDTDHADVAGAFDAQWRVVEEHDLFRRQTEIGNRLEIRLGCWFADAELRAVDEHVVPSELRAGIDPGTSGRADQVVRQDPDGDARGSSLCHQGESVGSEDVGTEIDRHRSPQREVVVVPADDGLALPIVVVAETPGEVLLPVRIALRSEGSSAGDLSASLFFEQIENRPVRLHEHITHVEQQRLRHHQFLRSSRCDAARGASRPLVIGHSLDTTPAGVASGRTRRTYGDGMRRTGLVTHERYFWHDVGPSAGGRRPNGETLQVAEPADLAETKRRLLGLLDATGYSDHLTRLAPRTATVDEVLRFHTQRYLDELRTKSTDGFGEVGKSAYVGAGTYDIAMLAAGGALTATEAVCHGRVDNAYALIRPAGHHAEPDRGLGFCLLNNGVLAAMHARATLGIGRVVILDWDVHHGNGTQLAFTDNPEVLTLSIHQDGRFPSWTGKLDERGEGPGFGSNINVPLPPGSGHGAFMATMERVIVPALDRFRPELIIVSSGYDAGGFDSMAHMMAHSGTFRSMAADVVAAAARHAHGRLVVLHEGGYSTYHVPFCGLAVIEEMTGIPSDVADPFITLADLPYQDLQPHQAHVIDQAAAFVGDIP